MLNKYRHLWLKSVVIVALLSLLVACGSNGTNATGDTNTSGNASETPSGTMSDSNTDAVAPADVTITVWDQITSADPHKPLMDGIWKEFETKYPYIKLEHKPMPVGTDDRQTFVTAMAGGSGPDAYQAAHFPIIRDWVKQGFALDLTPYWEQYADKDQFIASSMEQATMDGKVYGLPNAMYVEGLLYNKTLFKAAGLDPAQPPKDWQQFTDYAKKLTDPAKQQYGYALLGMEWADWYFEYYVWQAGGDLTTQNDDGTVKLNFTDEPTVTALQYYKDLKWKCECVQKNVLQGINDNGTDFNQGRAAMILTASNAIGGLVAAGVDLNTVGIAPFPVGPSGKGPSQVGGAYWIINPKSSKEKQDAAWKYISYLMSKDVQQKLLQFEEDSGSLPNLLSVRKDVNPADYAKAAPQDLIDGVNKAAEKTNLEYFLKERLSPYVVKAVQKVLTDKNADPKTELAAVQATAQKEVADPYNKGIKK